MRSVDATESEENWYRVWSDPQGAVDSNAVPYVANQVFCDRTVQVSWDELEGYDPTERMRMNECVLTDSCLNLEAIGTCHRTNSFVYTINEERTEFKFWQETPNEPFDADPIPPLLWEDGGKTSPWVKCTGDFETAYDVNNCVITGPDITL